MNPRLATNDTAYRPSINPNLLANFTVCQPNIPQLSDSTNAITGQCRAGVRVTFRHPALFHSILAVLSRRPKKQVRRVHATRVVAPMADEKP
jgi:hypothetical protein